MATRQEVEKHLQKYIPKSTTQKFPADHGLKRAAYLLQLLGNPQECFRTIHIAGTSGKGTTAHLTSKLLTSHGLKVGLHLSPHLLDIRERMQISNKFITEKKFVTYAKNVIKQAQRCEKEFDQPTYFEVLTALAYFTFAQEQLDLAVIETGMGGTYDATNTIQRQDKLCVITKIGHDHTQILGNTLTQISSQKAGIIQQKNTVIVWNTKNCLEVFQKRAEEKKAKLYIVSKENIQNINSTEKDVTFDFVGLGKKIKNIHLTLPGDHQAENAALALFACSTAIKKLDSSKVKKTLNQIRFKGRLDIIKKNNTTFVIDGAHNEQKVKALVISLKKIYPEKKFTTIVAIKKGKDVDKILKPLKEITDNLILTTYFKNNQDLLHIAHETTDLKHHAKKLGYQKIQEAESLKKALKLAIETNTQVLITGSLYYLSDAYQQLEGNLIHNTDP